MMFRQDYSRTDPGYRFKNRIWFMSGVAAVSLTLSLAQTLSEEQQLERQRQEEQQDYFQEWLTGISVYIITEEERSIFESLSTDAEREKFIEQFWDRRDPDRRTSVNEFKEEHYRRIAYANEHFSAGWPGWMTDRGKVYIIHGPPDEIEELPSGGHYERTLHEGGGRTSVYPYQKWRYRHVAGMGPNIEIEFVDRDFSGIYRLALSSEQKDAFLHVPNAGFTAAEELGLAERRERPYFAPFGTYPLMNYRQQDSAFERYERFVDIQRPTALKYEDLKQIVDLKISYDQLPFVTRSDVFRLDERRVLVPVTLEIRNQDLNFQESQGIFRARAAVYGVVTNLSNQLVAEFEDEVVASFSTQQFAEGLKQSSAYNRVLLLDQGTRYKIQLVVKDLNSDRVGVRSEAILAPSVAAEELFMSPLVVSGYITPVEDVSDPDQMFVLGNVRIKPSLDKQFSPQDYFAVYLQLYNVAIDQSTQHPSFQVQYRILQGEKTILETVDEVGESVQYFSPRRMVLIKKLPLDELTPGKYEVEVAFTDRILKEVVKARETFRVSSRN